MAALSREEHFARLNEYIQTEEWKQDRYDFDALVGQKWEITEEIFIEFLEVLPPVNWKRDGDNESFCMSEAKTSNIRSKYLKNSNGYFHEYVRYPARKGGQ